MLTLLLACSAPAPTTPTSTAPSTTAPGTTSTGTTTTGGTTQPTWPATGLVLDHARVMDATGVRDGAVILAGDLIWDVTAPGQAWPAHLDVLDLAGAALLPALVDPHVHLFHSGATVWVGSTLAANLAAYPAWGVLTVGDVGSPRQVFALRDRLALGELHGPRVVATGPFLTAVGSHPCELSQDRHLCLFVDDAADPAELAASLVAEGADRLKVALVDNDFTGAAVPRMDLGDLAALVGGGGREVVAHVAQSDDAADALAAGVDHLAHPVFDAPVSAATAGLPFSSVHSTVGAFSGVVRVIGDAADLDDPAWVTVPAAVRSSWGLLQASPELLADGWLADNEAWAALVRANLPVYREAEAPLVAASDAGYWFVAHGVGLHQELEELVAAGWTPLEALAAGTVDAARSLGLDDRGLVAPGLRADLIVVQGDPSTDIRATQALVLVIQGGAVTDREALVGADPWRSLDSRGLCLDERDCPSGQACDRVDHVCRDACELPWAAVNPCGEDAWCNPVDALASDEGVCHPGDGCNWRVQDCQPAYYAEACVPADLDTSTCWPSGPNGDGDRCSYGTLAGACAPGLFCWWGDGRCHALCDPDEGPCADGSTCDAQVVGGRPWFGVCR